MNAEEQDDRQRYRPEWPNVAGLSATEVLLLFRDHIVALERRVDELERRGPQKP